MLQFLGKMVSDFTTQTFGFSTTTKVAIVMLGTGMFIYGIGSLFTGTAMIIDAVKRDETDYVENVIGDETDYVENIKGDETDYVENEDVKFENFKEEEKIEFEFEESKISIPEF